MLSMQGGQDYRSTSRGGQHQICNCCRVGKKDKEGSKSRPLRIQLEEVDHKRRVLSRGKRLKEVQDEALINIYLAPDLT